MITNNSNKNQIKPNQNTKTNKYELFPLINPDLKNNPKCKECELSIELNLNLKTYFDINICTKCIKNNEKYSLLTKTESKQDYLLTDGMFIIMFIYYYFNNTY